MLLNVVKSSCKLKGNKTRPCSLKLLNKSLILFVSQIIFVFNANYSIKIIPSQLINDNFNHMSFSMYYHGNQTFSVRACARTRAGAAIFVQMGAQKCSEMCVRVRACVYQF